MWQAAPATGVTSVGLSLPSLFTVSGSPITASGTLSATLAVQGKNKFFGGPASGVDTAPDFRVIDPLDIPDLSADKITSGVFSAARIPNIPAANVTGALASSSIPSLDASKITSGTFGVAQGGTGLSAVGAAGTVLTSVGGVPAWQAVPAGLGGSGAFGQLAFWNASSTLAGNSNLIIDTVNSRLSIGSSAAPATTLVVAGDTTVGGDVVPSTASAYDFGSTTKPVRSVYSDNLGSATQRIKAAYIDELYIYGGAGGSGTSTISATQTVFNGIAYNWPNGGLGNNFVLTTDTNGNLGWQNPTSLVPESGWRSLAGNIRLGVITDKVGIGTAAPATKLDVVGDIQASGFLSSGTGQIKFGGATYSFPTSLPSSGQILTASSTPGNLQFRSLAATDIPALDASKITTGIFSSAQIPAVSSSSIPNLDASKITTGVFPVARGGTGLAVAGANGQVLTTTATGVLGWTTPTAGVGGTGTVSTLPIFTGTSTIGNSLVTQTGNEVRIMSGDLRVMATTTLNYLNVANTARLQGNVYLGGGIPSGTTVMVDAGLLTLTGGIKLNGPSSFLRGDINIGMPNGPEAGVGVLKINNGSLVIPFGAGAGKVLTSDNAGNASWQATAAGGVSGSGAVNAIPLFSTSSTVSNSVLSQVPGTTPYVVPGSFSVLTGAATTVNATSNIAIAGNLYVGAVGGINDIVGLTRFGRDISTTSGNITATNGQVVGNNGVTAGVSINALNSSVSIGNAGMPFASLFTKALSLSTGAGVGKVLTSDAAGNATWQTPTTNNDIQRPGVANLSVAASMPSSVTGQFNVALGGASLNGLTGGGANTAIGNTVLFKNTIGDQNTALGWNAAYGNISGSRNVAIGANAGFNSTGSNNTLVGTTADANAGITNATAIGWGATATKNNQVVLGGASVKETLLRGSVITGGNLLPEVDNVYDLGSPTKRWRDIYVGPATIKVVGNNGQVIESIGEGSGANAGKLVVKSSAGERLIGASSTPAINLGSVNQDILPDVNDQRSVGDATHRFVNGYFSGRVNANVGMTVGGINFPIGAGAGKVLTSDASGEARWSSVSSCGDSATDCNAPRNLNVGNGISFTWRQGVNQAGIFDKDNGYLHINGKAIMITTSGLTPSLVYLGKRVDNIITGNVSAVKLSVNANSNTDPDGIINSSKNLVLDGGVGGGSTSKISFRLNGSEKGSFSSSGFAQTSDLRLKENITPLTDVLGKLDALDGVNFTWKSGKDKKKQLGVIAQDVEKSFPELVDTDSVTGMKSVNYSGLAAVAIQGVKELDAKVEAALPVTGEGVIRPGESEVLIFTSQASTGAKIFVTPVGSTGGQTLYVGEVVDGKYFTVKADKALRSPARFNWMIIK